MAAPEPTCPISPTPLTPSGPVTWSSTSMRSTSTSGASALTGTRYSPRLVLAQPARAVSMWLPSSKAPRRPPQRLPPPPGDQLRHLHLIEPQPHERVGRGRQLPQLAGAFPDDRDQLPSRVDTSQGRRQQLRRPRPGRHIEGDQRPVPVRRQRRENLVELAVRDTTRDPVRHPWPIQPAALVTVGLHRIVVRVRPPAPPGPIERERVDDRPAAHI